MFRKIREVFGKALENLGEIVIIFIVCAVASIIANLITGCAIAEKYLPATSREIMESKAVLKTEVDAKGEKKVRMEKNALIKGIEKL